MTIPERYQDQLERVRLMASGDDQWDLSDNDCAALKAILDRLDKLDSQTYPRGGYPLDV